MDLECGRVVSVSSGEEAAVVENSVCSSRNSKFFDVCSTDILEDETLHSRKVSSMTDSSDCSVEVGQKKVHLSRKIERDCRICHLSLVSSSPGSGLVIDLGCSCKDDLAAAHKLCAETWFKIKGNKVCEICNSIARNIVGPNDIESLSDNVPVTTISSESPSCLNGHRFLNLLLACMVFAFVISWLFHFNIPS